MGHTEPESQHQDFRWIWVLAGTVADSLLVITGTQVVLVVKNLPADAGDTGDPASIPGSGRSPRGRHGNPLQYSCLKNPMDRGTWWLQSMGSQRVGHD